MFQLEPLLSLHIDTFCFSGSLFYFTSSGFIYAYTHASLRLKKPLDFTKQKPTKLELLNAQTLVLYIDSVLYFYSTETLTQIQSPIKSVQCFSHFDNLLILFKRPKSLMLYQQSSNKKFTLLNESSNIPFKPKSMTLSSSQTLCFVDSQSFQLFNLASDPSDSIMTLFPYAHTPHILSILQDEFLLVSTNADSSGLGLFITLQGDPTRGTLQWPSSPASLAFSHPFIYAYLPALKCIHVHHLLNQKLVSTISVSHLSSVKFLAPCLPFSPFEITHPDSIKSSISVILVASEGVFGLSLANVESQIEHAFELHQIPDAIQYAEDWAHSRLSDDDLSMVSFSCFFNEW